MYSLPPTGTATTIPGSIARLLMVMRAGAYRQHADHITRIIAEIETAGRLTANVRRLVVDLTAAIEKETL